MGLKDIALTVGATITVTPSENAVILKKDSVMIPNGAHFVFAGDTNPGTRRSITVKHRAATLNPKTGTFGKTKHEVSLVMPEISIVGKPEFPLIRLTLENSPNTNDPDVTMHKMLNLLAQFIVATAGEDFWKYGSPE